LSIDHSPHLEAFGLQPHRRETFKLSSDPRFVEKVRDIVDGVGLGLDAAALEEGNDIVGMNPDEVDATLAQSLDRDALMAAGRFKAASLGLIRSEPGPRGLSIIGDPLDPGAAGNTDV
jgi:hypothetical protein